MSAVDLPAVSARYYDEPAETMAREELEQLQLELLGPVLEHAYEHSPLYRTTWDAAGVTPADVRSLDDFREKIPFVDKDAIRRWRDEHDDPYGGILCADPGELTAVMSTSGTTGDPTLVPEVWGGGDRPAVMHRDFWEIGVRPGDHVTLFLFTFRGPVYAFVQGLGATPLLLDHHRAELPRLVELSRAYRPTALYNAGGTMLKALAELADREQVDAAEALASYRGVVTAGEPTGARARALASDWGIELFEHTSVGDVTASFECREHDGLHYWEDTALVEGIHPAAHDHRDATPVPDGGRAELVATTLFDRVAPLIRYRSDDLVRLDRSRCGCGRTHARMWPLGRKGDEVVVDGRAVLPTDLWDAVESHDATATGLFQVIRPRREVDRLRLRVGHAATGGSLEALRDDVAAAVQRAVGLEPEIELVPDDELLALGPPHKIPRVTRA